MTFVVNVHDWVHVDESADTIIHLVDIFEKYNARGDFYFTAEVTRQYAEKRPDVIERIKKSNMTVSYHVRPPHPLYTGFDKQLKGLSDAELYQTLLDYETYALDLSTGQLDRSRAGGYTYVAQVFGRKPVAVPVPNDNPRIKETAQKVYASLGAQMTLLYHESGADINLPFQYVNGLLVRPSDFSVTRVQTQNGENFWWNMLALPGGNQYQPATLLQTGLADWQSHNYPRAPFVTALIHENNFYRAGAEAWTGIYFKTKKNKNVAPLSPPYDLNAADPSTPRSEAEQQSIWDAYAALVAYAAANMQVVTSEDILLIAKQSADSQPASVQLDVTYCVMDGVELKMDTYTPRGSAIMPAVVDLHGGGWTKGHKSDTIGEDAPMFMKAGVVVFSINYRLGNKYKFPAMIEDAKCAVRSIRAHAAEYHVDPQRIGAYGGSAGGHLAALLGLTDTSAGFDVGEYLEYSSRVQAVVNIYGPSDLTQMYQLNTVPAMRDAFLESDLARASPIAYVSADDPPFLIVHGAQDQVVPPEQSRILYELLSANRVPAELIMVENAGHDGFRVANAKPTFAELSNIIADFLADTLK
jgi:acetyl esterase/lipase